MINKSTLMIRYSLFLSSTIQIYPSIRNYSTITTSFYKYFPNFSNYWHRSRNKISPKEVTYNSTELYWFKCWVCKNPFQISPFSLNASSDIRCGKCKQFPLQTPENISSEFHSSLNKEIDFNTIVKNKQYQLVWWKCHNNHVWLDSYNNRIEYQKRCKECIDIPFVKEKAFLNKLFHPVKNLPFKFNTLMGFNIKVWWVCSLDKNHIFFDRPSRLLKLNSELKYQECPYCSYKYASTFWNVKLLFPQLEQQLDIENSKKHYLKTDLSQYSIFNKTDQLIWKCLNGYNHSYIQSIYDRILQQNTCIVCEKSQNKTEPFKNIYNVLSFPFHHQFNYKRNYTLETINQKEFERKNFWWKCSYNHEFSCTFNLRSKSVSFWGCPICQINPQPQILFANRFPQYIKYFHPTKNGSLDIKWFSSLSKIKVYWLCENNHFFYKSFYEISKNGFRCKNCYKIKIKQQKMKENIINNTPLLPKKSEHLQ